MALKIGITGASGFIGSALVRHFSGKGDIIVALDGLVFPEDGGDPNPNLPEALDWVLHFGASTAIADSFANPSAMYRANLNSTLSALEIAMEKKARFLFMSSYVYGRPEYLPIDEKHPTTALNPYMGSKLAGELICRQFHDIVNLDVAVLRGFTFYGPGQTGDMLIPSIIESIKTHRPIVVRDPNPSRDYVHSTDFVRLVELLARSDFSGFDVFNVGGGIPHNNLAVAETANGLALSPVEIQVLGVPRRGDVNECYADISKVEKRFGWKPEIDLEHGLKDCLGLVG